MFHGLYFGLFTFFFKKFHKKPLGVLAISLLWVFLEIIRAKGEIGFPWIVLFLSQKNNLPLIQLSEFTGPFFISFLIIFFNVSLFSKKKTYIISSFSVLIICEIFGFLLLKRNLKYFDKIRVAIYQPDIPLTSSINEEFRACSKIYDSLAVKNVYLSIFPESSIPSFARYDTVVRKIVKNFVNKTNSYLIFGNADAIKIKGKYKFYNTAFLVNKKGQIINYYYKTHLTPFGEALPYDERFPILRKLQFGQGNYSRGKELRIFDLKRFRAFVLICFESIFTEISREAVKKGANVLINITSDGWFGPSLGPRVHRDLAIFRAIETRRYILRSARSGISCIIDEKGRILKEIPLFKRGVLTYEIPVFNYLTFYVKYGNLIEISFILFFIIFWMCSLFFKI